MYKLVIIDDEPLVRFGLKTTINWADYGIVFCGEAENGIAGIKLVEEVQPDIVLTDVKMPLLDGLEMISKIRKFNKNVEFIILSGYGEFEFAKVAFKHDVVNYLLKPVSNEELIDTILRVIERIKAKELVVRSEFVLENSQDEINRKIIRILIHESFTDLAELNAHIAMFNVKLFDEGFVVVGVLDNEDDRTKIFNKLKELQNIVIAELNTQAILQHSGIYHDRVVLIINMTDVHALEAMLFNSLQQFKKHSAKTISFGISDKFSTVRDVKGAYDTSKGVATNGLLRFVNSVQIYNGESQVYSQNLLRVMDVINREFMDNIDVTSVSQKLDVSPSYLMHMLKDDIGITFNTLLIMTRIREAKVLLRTNEYRVYEVASKVGFNDEKYFSMVFKKYEGMTPSQYMRHNG